MKSLSRMTLGLLLTAATLAHGAEPKASPPPAPAPRTAVVPPPRTAAPPESASDAHPPPASPSADALARAGAAGRQDLDKSLRELAVLRTSIQAEKIPMTRELGRLETELTNLRQRYDDTARNQDMATLEVTNLSGAMKVRQEETDYISTFMDEYARGFDSLLHVSEIQRYAPVVEAARLARENADLSLTEKLRRQVALLKVSLARLEDLVGGTRFPGEAVDSQGTVAQGQFAMFGPVVMFASTGGGAAGLAVPQAGSTRAAVRSLDQKFSSGLVQVVTAGVGTLPLDPTRGGALKDLVSRGNLIGYFHKGGPIMWPLLCVSLLATTVIFERLLFLAREKRRRDPAAVDGIMERVGAGDVDGAIEVGGRSEDFVARALTYALTHRQKSLSNALMRASGQELLRYTRGISILDTCVTMAPLLGLLGTVTGMMGSFGMLGGGELSAPGQITGGIAEALIATAFGLGIAVTSLIPMNYLHSKSDQARHEIEDASTHLELLMKPIQDFEAHVAQQGMLQRFRENHEMAVAGH